MDQAPTVITVEALIQAPRVKVWQYWTTPDHIQQWNNASEAWHTPYAENDLKPGGKFLSRMEAKDGSMGFDFVGTYDEVILHECIRYVMEDGRKAKIIFSGDDTTTYVVESFDAENMNSIELQQQGWQSILNNFKNYVESK